MTTWSRTTSIAVLLIPVLAHADPDPKAVDEMHWAIHYCEKAFEDKAGSTAKEDLDEWTTRRAKAVSIDAKITTFAGKEAGGATVAKWVVRCDKELPEFVAKLSGADDSNELAQRALIECREALDPQDGDGEAEYAKYKELRDKARKIDRSAQRDKLDECDKKIPLAITVHKKMSADSDAVKTKQIATAIDENKKQNEADAKRRNLMMKKLKGDRRSVYDSNGEPSEYAGNDPSAARANVWTYTDSSSDTGTRRECVRVFRFKGNKLVKQTKSKWCD